MVTRLGLPLAEVTRGTISACDIHTLPDRANNAENKKSAHKRTRFTSHNVSLLFLLHMKTGMCRYTQSRIISVTLLVCPYFSFNNSFGNLDGFASQYTHTHTIYPFSSHLHLHPNGSFHGGDSKSTGWIGTDRDHGTRVENSCWPYLDLAVPYELLRTLAYR